MSADRLPSLPALLRDLRQKAGLTQEELAQGARVGVRTLRDLETGRAARPQRSTVDLLASALGLRGAEREDFVAAARGRPTASPGRRTDVASVTLRPAVELIGRQATVLGIAALLEVAGLVTLVGLAGVGKTVLSVAVGHHVADRFPVGVGGVTVAAASTESELLASIASAFGVARIDGLPAHLGMGSALLVLDGVDRNREAALSALATLCPTAPALRVLATSRQPLHLPDEHEWPVPPLDVPPPSAAGAEVFSYPATALFLDRLRRVRRRPVGPAEADTVAALVRRLGGVPLALELAAARGRVLDLPQMLRRAAAAGDADPAGQSLRDAVMASWRLLAPAEQACLSWLATFQWRWSVNLAEELLGGEAAAGVGGDVVALVDRLVALGLVSVRPDEHELRFWLLDPVRDVALEQAARGGALSAARDRHAAVMVSVAARAVSELTGPTAARAAMRLDHLASDLYAALEHLRGLGADATASALDVDIARWRGLRGLP